jgi:hypothetical protein
MKSTKHLRIRGSWQIRATMLSVVVGTPGAGLVLMAWKYPPTAGAAPRAVLGFIATYALFGIPISYAFGAAPALIATGAYCAILTLIPTLQKPGAVRASVGAACGGLSGAFWFSYFVDVDSNAYALVTALGTALISLWLPAYQS